MSNNTKLLSERFSINLSESSFKKFERELNGLIESLENKHDPDLTEIRLTSSLYEFHEKLQILKQNLNSYVNEMSQKNVGDILNRLYDYSDDKKYLKILD